MRQAGSQCITQRRGPAVICCGAMTGATHSDATTALAETTRRRVTRRLLPFLFLLYVIAYIDRINVSFAGLQMTKDLGFSDAVFGFGSGVFFIGYLLLGIPGAILVERWSARKMIAATMVIWGVVASATGLIHTAMEFYIMRFVLGITEAGFFPGVITYLGNWHRPRDRAKAIAIFMAAIPASQVIAAPISAALMKAHWFDLAGWRWLLILEGAPALVCGVITALYLTDRPRDAHWLEPAQRNWLMGELEQEQARKASARRISVWGAMAHRDVLLLAGAYFGGSVVTYGLTLWMPKMIQRFSGLSVTETAILSAIPALVAIPVMLVNGWHSDRTGERRWHAAIARFTTAAALIGAVFVTHSVVLMMALLTIAYAGVAAAFPPIWAMPTAFLGATAAAASIGLINSFGNVGGFAGPYAIGLFSSRTGAFVGGLWCMAIATGASALLLLLIPARRDPAARS
jgi:MFS transporter, ACS family, tartrate transporter